MATSAWRLEVRTLGFLDFGFSIWDLTVTFEHDASPLGAEWAFAIPGEGLEDDTYLWKVLDRIGTLLFGPTEGAPFALRSFGCVQWERTLPSPGYSPTLLRNTGLRFLAGIPPVIQKS